MMTTKRDWVSLDDLDGRGVTGLWVCVADDQLAYWCQMGAGDTVDDMLADYAAGYEGADEPITVKWELCHDGDVIHTGRNTFMPGR